MRINKQFFDKLEAQINKDWGDKCWHKSKTRIKNFAPMCAVCQAWLAYETLRDLYGIDYEEIKK